MAITRRDKRTYLEYAVSMESALFLLTVHWFKSWEDYRDYGRAKNLIGYGSEIL